MFHFQVLKIQYLAVNFCNAFLHPIFFFCNPTFKFQVIDEKFSFQTCFQCSYKIGFEDNAIDVL